MTSLKYYAAKKQCYFQLSCIFGIGIFRVHREYPTYFASANPGNKNTNTGDLMRNTTNLLYLFFPSIRS